MKLLRLSDAIRFCETVGDEHVVIPTETLLEWLRELQNLRSTGPRCPGCGSPVVKDGDECHSCRENTHNPDNKRWLAKYRKP